MSLKCPILNQLYLDTDATFKWLRRSDPHGFVLYCDEILLLIAQLTALCDRESISPPDLWSNKKLQLLVEGKDNSVEPLDGVLVKGASTIAIATPAAPNSLIYTRNHREDSRNDEEDFFKNPLPSPKDIPVEKMLSWFEDWEEGQESKESIEQHLDKFVRHACPSTENLAQHRIACPLHASFRFHDREARANYG
jgi:hypothetical protein